MKNIYIYFMLCLFGLGIQSVQGMPLYVKITTATTITLEVDPSDTVDNVKQKIQELQGILQSQQMLFFAGVKLEDASTLTDNNIQSGDTIDFIPIHTIISVVSGTGFNIKTGTVLGAEGLDLTPSTDFSLTSSLSGSAAVSISTTIAHINKSFLFNETTAGYSGLLKFNYLDTELNSLSASGLKLLYHDGSAWAIDDSSSAADKYLELTLTSKTLKELSLGNCTITDAPTIACYQTATWNPATCQYDITGTQAAAPTASAQTFCAGNTVADLVATGTNLKWYDMATEGTALANSTALVTGTTYYVSQTENGCESARTSVAVTVITTLAPWASPQTFCGSKTVADLLSAGSDSKWYNVATDGTPLEASASIATATYYVSQTLNSCESKRTPVYVTVNNSVAGTISAGQLIVRGTQPAAISLTDSSGSVQWQISLNNIKFTNIVGATGTTLTSNQMGVLTSRKYYRAILSTSCNSATSEVVQVWTTLTTKIQDSQCGKTLASLTTMVSANSVPGADYYRFKVVQGASTRTIVTRTKGFSLTALEDGALLNTTYTISVASQSMGIWSDYGSECTVTTPSGITKIQNSQCGQTLASLTTNLTADAVAGVTNYRFKVVHGETTRFLETTARFFNLKSLDGGVFYNTAYTISVATKYNGNWSNYGTECTVTTPSGLTKIKDSQCGQTLASLSTNVVANAVTGVTNYRFKVVQGGTTRFLETTASYFNLKSLVGGVFYNTTYTVSVATQYNEVWGDYGSECNITTPSGLTKIKDSQCGIVLASLSTSIAANAVTGASHYSFKVVQGGTSRTIETGTAAFSLKSLVGGTSSGTTYTISVATKYNGVWGEYGAECTVTTPSLIIPSVSRQAATASVFDTENVLEAVSVVAYPNPFTTTFKLDFQSSSEANVAVFVYDMLGKLLENLNSSSSEINNLELGRNYPSGVYNVIVTQGSEVKTLRVIKE